MKFVSIAAAALLALPLSVMAAAPATPSTTAPVATTTDMPAPTTMPTKSADVDPNAPVQEPNAAAPAGNVE